MNPAKEARISDLLSRVPLNAIRHINGHIVKRFVDGYVVDHRPGLSFDSAVARLLPTINGGHEVCLDGHGNPLNGNL